MKEEYLSDLLDLLNAEVPELRWTDADEGQLDFYTDERPPVAWPCCLVELSMPDTRDLSSMGDAPQRCTLRAVLTVAFNDCAGLNTRTPKSVREVALKRFDLLEKIKKTVHGKWFNNFQQPYLRRSCVPQKREDGLKVYEMTFDAAVID
ncbi:hypothetical protein [uncultured Phocaeicola sp.]|uniref:hypothetical protein n=1 Tax=uncultured Phocaeicola sp. TaxID=990718 RepID=UPI002597497C|nr:hypothetical protein [uncultured Phocaeicola sp.]